MINKKIEPKVLIKLVIFITIVAVAFVGYFFWFRKINQSGKQIEKNVPICKPDESEVTAIYSLSSSSVSIGDTIKISGCNLRGFEGDKNIWIENSAGVKGILYGTRDADNENIQVTLTSPVCEADNSYSGLPCKNWLTLTPGVYKIYTIPWDKASNEVSIKIK
jgi:hypothetical protein